MRGNFPNIRHLRIFLETARSGSVSDAAKRCYLSQPAATQAISRLEEVVGLPLLTRNRKRAALTEIGALFAARAEKALDHIRHCLLYTSPSPRDATLSRMPSSA